MKKITLVDKIFIIPAMVMALMLFFISCQKNPSGLEQQPGKPPSNETYQPESRPRVFVSTVAELYSAVNDPLNVGKEIVLAPGTYVLDAGYPNSGRLDLQENMGLQGQAGQLDAVLLDASSLPVASFVSPTGRTGAIRMGRGANSLEWFTIKGGQVSSNPFSVINTDLPSAETNIRISHLVVNQHGSNLGINLRNILPANAGRKIYAMLEDNEVYGGVNFVGAGLAFQNANGASNCLISVTMRNNYIHGNKIGIFAFSTAQNTTIENSRIEVVSYSDRIEGNGVGMDPSAGVNQSILTTAHNNSATFIMYGTSIRFNNASPALTPTNGALPGGIFAATAYNSPNNFAAYNRASNNYMKLEFHGCDISDNNGMDIYGYGAWCPPVTVLAGSNNTLDIYLYGTSSTATVEAHASVPVEPAGTNVINVIRN
jgi:hypothetical protein